MGKQGPRTSYLLVSVLLLIVIAFAVSYYRYIHTLGYDLFLAGPCDPATEICVVFEEETYGKYLVHAQSVAMHCSALGSDSCIEKLLDMNLAIAQDCEAYLDEGESCTSPEDYASESLESTETGAEE